MIKEIQLFGNIIDLSNFDEYNESQVELQKESRQYSNLKI